MTYNKPGRLILFEGGDGSGKTSQLQAIAQWLPAFTPAPIITTKEPYQDSIRQHLSHALSPMAELFLFMSDRAQHFDTLIQPKLEQGAIVLCDRGFPSTYAYQGHGRKLNINSLALLNGLATEYIDPDLVIWLDVPPDIGLARSGRGDRLEQESLEFHNRVRAGYANYAAAYPNVVVKIDATQPAEAVTERIQYTLRVALHLWGKS